MSHQDRTFVDLCNLYSVHTLVILYIHTYSVSSYQNYVAQRDIDRKKTFPRLKFVQLFNVLSSVYIGNKCSQEAETITNMLDLHNIRKATDQ